MKMPGAGASLWAPSRTDSLTGPQKNWQPWGKNYSSLAVASFIVVGTLLRQLQKNLRKNKIGVCNGGACAGLLWHGRRDFFFMS